MNDNEQLDAVHHALACVYRRQVMKYLIAAEDDVVAVAELVDDIVNHDETTENRRRVAIKLHHSTLPKLVAHGFIEYDDRSRTVRYREAPVLERVLHRSGAAPEVS